MTGTKAELDVKVIETLIDTLYGLVDSGLLLDPSPELEYWHNRLVTGDSDL